MENKLDIYLRTRRVKAQDLARAANLTDSTVSRLRRNRQAPTLAQAFAIEDATAGEVPARSWIECQPIGRPREGESPEAPEACAA